MSKTITYKVLVLLVLALLITNLGMLYYFTGKKDEPKNSGDRQVEWLKKELKLSDAQTQTYVNLRHKRDSLLMPLNATLRQSKLKMIALLRQPSVPDSIVRSIAAEITDHQLPIEEQYYQHFRRVQAMCNAEQLPILDSIMVRMVTRNTGGKDSSANRR
ncbi:MAG: periplasmic heavy metal sensor [Bacteroidetes bacterium]|nr:MAG: periplasmic heavy metal sensor [Bacteroidota bacterium]